MLNKIKRWFFDLIFKLKITEMFNKYHRISEFKKDYKNFKQLSSITPRLDNLPISSADLMPMLDDKTTITNYDHAYVYHISWAARVLHEQGISEHVDIGSYHYFATLVSAFLPIHFFDYRPMDIHLDNLSSEKADLLHLDFEENSISSLSCMHVIEHIGLGRYGDEIDPVADIYAIHELTRVLKPKGHLLFVVPVGRPRVCFNAHRIYDPVEILNYFKDLDLVEFSVVTDKGVFSRGENPNDFIDQIYACGMYHFQKG
jgi:SAM-dependent methyltransferase